MADAAAWHRVADSNALEVSPSENRLHLAVDGRFVSVIAHGGRLYCVDSACFHAGGPLALGEIEELNDDPCLVCPWHSYVVRLADGQKFYQSASPGPDGKLQPGAWKSVGRRQRTHRVEARPDGLYVQLDLGGALASDEYARLPECGARVKSGTVRLGDAAHLAARPPSPLPGSPLPEGEAHWPADLVDGVGLARRSPSRAARGSGPLAPPPE